MGKLVFPIVIALMLAAIGGGAYYVLQGPSGMFTSKPALPTVPVAPAPDDAPAAIAPPAEPAIKYPIDAASTAGDGAPLPALAQSDSFITSALGEVIKRRDMQTFLQLDGLAKRVVATVDNLARPHAAPLLWPVNPTPGRFSTLTEPSGENKAKGAVIHPDNAKRYTPLVNFIDAIDSAKAAALYVRLYPLLQEAYVELGYPKGYFNDRLVTVIDHLLATPTPGGPLRVRLTEVKGPIIPARPWLRYEFEDPRLEALSSGQKMLIRTGPENQARLQAKLRELRQRVAASGPAMGAARP